MQYRCCRLKGVLQIISNRFMYGKKVGEDGVLGAAFISNTFGDRWLHGEPLQWYMLDAVETTFRDRGSGIMYEVG